MQLYVTSISCRLYPVYTIQPVVKPVVFDNWFDNRVEGTATVRSTALNEQPLLVKPGCTTTTGLTTGCIHDTRCIHDTVSCQTGCQTGLTTDWMFVYMIQSIVKPVWQPGWQPVVSCIQTFNRLSNQSDNQFDNMSYRVNGALRTRETRCIRQTWCKHRWTLSVINLRPN